MTIPRRTERYRYVDLKLEKELRVADVWRNRLSLILLEEFCERGSIAKKELETRLHSADDWLSLSRLIAADCVEEQGEVIVPTKAGFALRDKIMITD